MANIGTMALKLTADPSGFTRGLQATQKDAEKFVANVTGALSSLGRGDFAPAIGQIADRLGLGGGGIAQAAGLATGAISAVAGELKSLVEAGTSNLTQQASLARRFQLSTDEAGALQLAAARYNVTNEDLTSGLAHVSRQLGAARRGSQEAGHAFEALGLDARRLTHDAGAAAEVLEALGRLDVSSQQDVGRRIFGRHGQEMIRLANRLAQEPGGLDAIRQQGLESGAIAGAGQVAEVSSGQRELQRIRAEADEARRANANAVAGFGLQWDLFWARWRRNFNQGGGFLSPGAYGRALGTILPEQGRPGTPAERLSPPEAAPPELFLQLRQRLQEEIRTIGYSNAEREQYRLAQQGATQAQLQQTAALQGRHGLAVAMQHVMEAGDLAIRQRDELGLTPLQQFMAPLRREAQEAVERARPTNTAREQYLQERIPFVENQIRLGQQEPLRGIQVNRLQEVLGSLTGELNGLREAARSAAKAQADATLRETEAYARQRLAAQEALRVRTPLELFRAEMARLGELRLNTHDYGLSGLRALEQLEGQTGSRSDPFAQAQQFGGAQAMETIARWQAQQEPIEERVARAVEAGLEQQRQANEIARQTAMALERLAARGGFDL